MKKCKAPLFSNSKLDVFNTKSRYACPSTETNIVCMDQTKHDCEECPLFPLSYNIRTLTYLRTQNVTMGDGESLIFTSLL